MSKEKIGKRDLTKEFPTLYKKASSGATVEWTISVEGSTIVKRWGQTGGAIQETRDVIKEGKNVGKANATTAEEQAVAEATAQWVIKQKKDYIQDKAKAGQASELIEGGVLPMLAKKYSDDGDKITFPCAVQSKLDGHRCLAVVDAKGKCTLWSRTRKAINSVPHIVKAIENLKVKNIVFDGELYNAEYKDKFEELTHFIRQSTVQPGHEVVHYHIYDIADPASPFLTRTLELDAYNLSIPLVKVETITANDEDELMLAFERFLAQGYEGAMARNFIGKYGIGKRSNDLQKIKQFSDSEYLCLDVEEGRGKLAGHAIFVCKTPEGELFRAKMMGSQSELKRYWDDPTLVVGKQVTIKYQGISSYGIPRFPVALRVREDI